MDERRFPRTFQSLEAIFEFTREFFAREGIDDRHRFPINFAVEEVFTNMVKYHRGNPHEIAVGLERTDARLQVSLTDFDVDPFDPNDVPEPQVDLPLAERQPGGLGLFLTKKLMDRVDYEYAGRTSRILLTKSLE